MRTHDIAAANGALVTLMNNAGVTKSFHEPPAIDQTQQRTVTVAWNGEKNINHVQELKNNQPLEVDKGNSVQLHLAPGDIAIVQIVLETNK